MREPGTDSSLAIFREPLLSAIAEVLSQISGQRYEVAQPEQVEEVELDVRVNFLCEGALEGAFAFCLSTEAAVRLAKLLTSEPVPEPISALTAEDREALDELLRQVAGQAATRLRPAVGKTELKFMGMAGDCKQGQRIGLTATTAGESLRMELLLDQRLQQSIAAAGLPPPSPTAVENSAPASPACTAAPAGGGLAHRAIREGNLDLLLDVTLAVTLRFGQREMLLKEILELSPGSVVELDREINEPVDLLLDKKLIARGEVVIIDGDYGLRVTEVASAAEKMACLP